MSVTPEGGQNDYERTFREMIRGMGEGPLAPEVEYPGMEFRGRSRWERIHRHWRKVVLGVGAIAVVGGVVVNSSIERSLPRDTVSEARLLALKDPRALVALGACDPELRIEASLEAYRISRGMGEGSKTGVTVSTLQNAASVARTYGVPCSPKDKSVSASHDITVSDGSQITILSGYLTKIDAADVCDLIENPDHKVAPDPADAQNYERLVQQLAMQLADQTSQSC